LKVALVDGPNVGKSVFSIGYCLRQVYRDRNSRHHRDSLSELLNIDGVPVLLTDTAGMREANDPVEHLGIERTRRAIADADLFFLCSMLSTVTDEDGHICG
jgi:tRNA modification GTPase